MTTPTLADRLAGVLRAFRYDWRTVSRCGVTFEEPYKDEDGEWIDDRFNEVRPAVLTLLRDLLREERARCAAVVEGWIPSIDGSPATAIRNLGDCE